MHTYSLTVHVPDSVLETFKDGGFNTSDALRRAILKANHRPERLVNAFRMRLDRPTIPGSQKNNTLTFRHGPDVAAALQRLAGLTNFSVEQVIRLVMESEVNERNHV